MFYFHFIDNYLKDVISSLPEAEEGYDEWKERILKEATEKLSQRKYNN